MMQILLLNGLTILDDTIDTSAVDKLFEWLQNLLNTNLVTVSGVSITIGILILALIKFLFPKNKIIVANETQNAELKEENAELKTANEELESRVATLEAKMDVVTANTQNKRIREAYYIKVAPREIYKRYEDTSTKAVKKKYKIKVNKNKAKEIAQEVATDVVNKIKDVISNGN